MAKVIITRGNHFDSHPDHVASSADHAGSDYCRRYGGGPGRRSNDPSDGTKRSFEGLSTAKITQARAEAKQDRRRSKRAPFASRRFLSFQPALRLLLRRCIYRLDRIIAGPPSLKTSKERRI